MLSTVEAELADIDKQIRELTQEDDFLSGLENSSEERLQQLIHAETGHKIRVRLERHDGLR